MTPTAPKNDSHLLALAMELLRQQLVKNDEAARERAERDKNAAPTSAADTSLGGVNVLKETQKIKAAGGQNLGAPDNLFTRLEKGLVGGVGSAFKAVGSLLTSRFAVLLAPLAVLGQIVSANSSGFSVLGSAVKVLAATLGPLLLPITFSLAVALIELSDQLWNDLAPALGDFYELVISTLLPAVSYIAKSMAEAAGAIIKFTQAAAAAIPSSGDLSTGSETLDAILIVSNPITAGLAALDGAIDVLGDIFSDSAETVADAAADFAGGSTGGGGDFGGAEAGGPGNATVGGVLGGGKGGTGRNAAADVIKELRLSFGPKASFSSLASAGRNAQLAALNQSPFEQRILDYMNEALGKLERVANNTARQPEPRYPGGGDF